ncbi:hypothetical protein HK097_008681 [Rhizophlyctis rosea]|uniref:Uncharacterized protein n=1 Tax=Rhizophlyctis rosea TaxID=64517 RepID=A0AAD5X4E5_9FUNG|nr:hypothetical protein HK097_008681 [Rhizophlyctis rosea]
MIANIVEELICTYIEPIAKSIGCTIAHTFIADILFPTVKADYPTCICLLLQAGEEVDPDQLAAIKYLGYIYLRSSEDSLQVAKTSLSENHDNDRDLDDIPPAS